MVRNIGPSVSLFLSNLFFFHQNRLEGLKPPPPHRSILLLLLRCGALEFRWVFTCDSRVSPTGSALSSPHRFLATHIRISPSYKRDDADDHRPDSDLGSHDGTGIGYVPLSSSNPRISLMLPQLVLTTGLTPDLCHRQQPNSHRQLELLTPFRLLSQTLPPWVCTVKRNVKKFQQKFKRVKDDMDKWDNLHAQLVSQFRNASSIIGSCSKSPKNYGSLKNLDNIKNTIFTKQMESLQKILLSMTKTLYDHQVASSPVSLCRYCSALIPSTLSFCWTSF
ncbi:unnamed protein product [Lactuca saligna]|uniref:Uncharacterized protein n=1 Tax=Lactuca saligna TaxID=75948 RepID=A0AA35ZB08_LACSI|nr:unnamed protein product [Lactuca saligna]